MLSWSPERVARAAGARLLSPPTGGEGPERVVIDSREAAPGTLFVGLAGARTNGGRFASQALLAGAWGVLVDDEHANDVELRGGGTVLEAADPLAALQRLATAWRRELGAKVIGVTGSTGKTSTKDLLLAVLAPQRRTVASRANYNTEIGLPIEILAAPAETEVLVLEMAMRGAGQIAELASLAEPDVGVIVSVGPVHLELLGTVEAIAAAKAELIMGLPPQGTAVIPAGEPLLEPHLPTGLRIVTFGEGGDVSLRAADQEHIEIDLKGEPVVLEVPFQQAHLRRNLLAAVAAADAVGVRATGRVEFALGRGRGERTTLPGEITLIDDCYNANPMSMRAALEDFAASTPSDGHRRRVAVLGDMLELGPEAPAFHEQVGALAGDSGIEVLIAVGPLAAAMGERFEGEFHRAADPAQAASLLEGIVRPGDAILVKGSRAVGLELVCAALRDGAAV